MTPEENARRKEYTVRSNVMAETRSGEDGKRHITGIIPYDKESEDLGGFTEVIRKGAFEKTLKESDVRCLWAHNTQYVLGRSSAGTFTITDEDDGLHFDCALPNTSWANDVFESVSRRDAQGVSFGFFVVRDAWDRKTWLRELLEVNLLEISVGVAFPAYPDTDSEASTRSRLLKAGIDIDALASALESEERSDEEKQVITRAMETLGKQATADAIEPPDEGTRQNSTPADEATLKLRERELLLLELEALR